MDPLSPPFDAGVATPSPGPTGATPPLPQTNTPPEPRVRFVTAPPDEDEDPELAELQPRREMSALLRRPVTPMASITLVADERAEAASTVMSSSDGTPAPMIVLPPPPMTRETFFTEYWRRLRGEYGSDLQPPPWWNPTWDLVPSFVLSCLAMGVLLVIDRLGIESYDGLTIFFPPFAASCVLLYGAPHSTAAQPRCVVAAHTVAAVVGVSLGWAFSEVTQPWNLVMTNVTGTSIFILVQQWTRCLHPSATSTVIAAAQAALLRRGKSDEGFLIVIFPAVVGSLILLVLALIGNNAVTSRSSYPLYW